MSIDFKGLNKRVLPRLESLLRNLYPLGKTLGREFKIGSLQGAPGQSLSINIDTGLWSDFAMDLSGHDFVSLMAAKVNCDQALAAELVEQILRDPDRMFKPETLKPVGMTEEHLLGPDPTYTPDYFILTEWGLPSNTHEYRDYNGRLLFVVCRYQQGEDKTYRPWSWNGIRWEAKAFTKDRPLYNLSSLNLLPQARVLIVEGEKCADFASTALAEYFVPTTWAGGAKAVSKSSWGVLKGRHVVIWPDNDPPGHQAAADIVAKLRGIAASLSVVRVQDLPLGADIADLEEVEPASLATWIENSLAPEDVKEQLAIPMPSGEAWKTELILSDKGAVRSSVFNVKLIVMNDEYFSGWFVELWDGRIMINNEPSTDAAIFLARTHLSSTWRIEVSGETMYSALSACLPAKNSVTEWLGGLTWDKTSRFTQLAADVLKVEGAYAAEAMRLLFTAMVARAMDPGCKFDQCFILRGTQGIGKTLFFEKLGGDRYVMLHAKTGSQDKDVLGAMASGWLVSVEELFDTRVNLRELKSILTSTSDTWRKPYAHDFITVPKRCVMVGTTDAEADFMDDPAGYRRFIILECTQEKFDIPLFDSIRDQLFAEAFMWWKGNADWYKQSPAMLAKGKETAEEREVVDPWYDTVATFVADLPVTTMNEVLSSALFIAAREHDPRYTKRVHSILHKLNFRKARTRVGGGRRLTTYERIDINPPST